MTQTRLHLALLLALASGCSSGGSDTPKDPGGAGGGAGTEPVVPAKKSAAALRSITGAVSLTRDGKTTPATTGPLYDKDVVETSEQSNALLRFPDGRELELGENGRIEVGTKGDELILNVGQGIVVSRVGAQGDGADVGFSIDTPYGLVRVGSGGVSLNVKGDETTVDVLAGDVTLVGREGASVALEAGSAGTLSKAGATRTVTLEPLVLTISQSTGRIEVKKKDAKGFSTINPRKPPSLATGDTVRVGNGSAALTAEKSDTKVTMLTGTEIGIGESSKNGGVEELALDLKKGQLQLAMAYGKKRVVKPGDGVSLQADQGGLLNVTRGKNGFELSSVVGDVVVKTEGGAPVTVKGGQVATITKSGVEARDVNREALQLPTRQGLRLLHPGAERVALVWAGDDDKPYRIKVGQDPALEKPSIDGIVRQTFFNTLAPARGTLFWRIFDGETELAKGSVVCGQERIDGELGELTNEVASTRPTTRIFFQDKPPSLTFTWKAPETPAAEYHLKVYKAGELSKPLLEKRTATTSAQLPPIPEGAYQWDITYLDASGAPTGTMGKMNTLEVQYDNAVRSLMIKAPRNGDAPAPKVAVTGVAPLGAKVSANGQGLTLDQKARFNGQVSPMAGSRVAFRVSHQGVETIIVRWLGRGGSR